MRGGGLEGENALQCFADIFFAEAKGDGVFFAGGAAIEREAELVEEKFFEDETLLSGGTEGVEGFDGFVGGREMRER